MLSVEWLAHDGTQVVPDLRAVERVRKDLSGSAGEQSVLRLGDLQGNASSGCVPVEDFGEVAAWRC
jgi:hypothetical protein